MLPGVWFVPGKERIRSIRVIRRTRSCRRSFYLRASFDALRAGHDIRSGRIGRQMRAAASCRSCRRGPLQRGAKPAESRRPFGHTPVWALGTGRLMPATLIDYRQSGRPSSAWNDGPWLGAIQAKRKSYANLCCPYQVLMSALALTVNRYLRSPWFRSTAG